MVEITKRDIDAIHETKDKVIRIETLLGNGTKGLCYDVRQSRQRIRRIEITIAFILGSSGIGGGIVAVVKLLGG